MKLETKLKHTPAPWQLSTIDGEDCLMVGGGDDGSMIVADIRTDFTMWSNPHDVVAANARLIAAAPELLDALMHVVAVLYATHNALDEYVAAGDDMLRNPLANKQVQDIADMATDALNKAIGENQE